jgi:hypothetical protein
MPFMTPADPSRHAELAPQLLNAVIFEMDNPLYPLHSSRTVRYRLSRWKNWGSFVVLDELCGADGLQDSFFPEIPPMTFVGEAAGSPDVLAMEIEWLGTDGAQITISYHKEAHVRMVDERQESLRLAAEIRAAECPPLADVLREYEKLGQPSWTPILEAGSTDAPYSSRYFGLPWMPTGAEWPVNQDGNQLGFVMQINVADLPSAMRSKLGSQGIIALFYDVDADWNPNYDGPEDHETAAVFLRFDTSMEGAVRQGRSLDGRVNRIAFWRAATDYPDFEDICESGGVDVRVQKFLIDNNFDLGNSHYRRREQQAQAGAVLGFVRECEQIWGANACDFETAAEVTDMFCAAGDKLGGWPAWDAGRRWPENNGKRMALFYQFDLMDPLWEGFSFWRGDERGHIFFDETDMNVFKLSWDRGNRY